MVDITHKISTFRNAVAQAIVKVGSETTIKAIQEKKVPKGDVLTMAKTAGFLGVKKTSDLIPDCHPMPIESCKITYELSDLTIKILVDVSTVYKTGVEVEAMHGASIVALTIYDMLKPIDKNVTIGEIKLLQKKGGKSSYKNTVADNFKAAVVVVSDSVSSGLKEDKAGKAIISKLNGFNINQTEYVCISDDKSQIETAIKKLVEQEIPLIITTGGTGLSPRDNTPDVIGALIDQPIAGIMEAARSYGQQRMPYAMLSRGIAGFSKKSLIITMPGSTRGAIETMDALFPYVLHVFKVLNIKYKH